jgi:hypothetical protein
MFHPTGKLPNGKTLICMMDEEENLDDIIDECGSSEQYVKAITEWLSEKRLLCRMLAAERIS